MTDALISFMDLTGQRIRVAQFGPETASRTLLVFNGIGASVETVAGFAACFRDTRIVTFDVPGVGMSPTPTLPYRATWLTRLTARLLDHLGLDRVDVMGVSWGGAIAQQFARDFPRRCSSLILAATSAGFVMVPGNIRVLKKMATPKRYNDPEYMLRIGPEIYGGQMRFNQELLEEHVTAMRTNSRRGYLYQLMAISGWTSWLWLPHLNMPALILMGGDDPVLPVVNGRILESRLPDARLTIMDCGHLFILSDPKGTAAEIEGFLDQNTARGAA